jgi:hypothetical protein
MKTILEDSRGLQEATPEPEPERLPGGTDWPHLGAPAPGGGPHLLASGMFLHRLHRPHLRRSLSRFDPRACVAPQGYK